MVRGRGDYIAGRFVRSRRVEELRSEDPGDLDHPVGVFFAAPSHVDAAVEAARRAGPGWAAAPLGERVAALQRVRARIAARADDLAILISREVGRPLWETRQEVATMQAKVDVTVGEALAEIDERHPVGLPGRVVYRPRGVVAVVGPFNFPGHLPHGQAMPALVAGCTIVIKPSELVPAVGELYAEIVDAAGLPPGVMNLIQGGPAIGEALVRHPDVAAVFFIGSSAHGQRIRRATLDQPQKLLALEMGGKNAALVLEDADLDQAAYEIARSAYATTGQRCTSTSRVFAARGIEAALGERLTRLASGLRVGYGGDEGVFMGPLASERGLGRFLAALRRAEREGAAETLVPAVPLSLERRGYYVSASLHRVRRPGGEGAYQREELFGPDLALSPVGDLEEALARANDTEYGLCMSVYTRRRAAYEKVLREGRAGVINWNRGTVGNSPRLPFGGIGRSGSHHPAGLFMIRAATVPVATLENPPGAGAGAGAAGTGALPPGLPRL